MDKYDCIELIITDLRGATGMNFQNKIKNVLEEYYRTKGLEYEMPSSYGGDKKNDGWVKNENIYYQIYAPTQIKVSLKKSILKKFEEDLKGLLKLIYQDKLWGKELKEYIFIVNTHDQELPENSNDDYEKITQKYREIYNRNFKSSVVNLKYISDILRELDLESLMVIGARLRINQLNSEEICTAPDVYEVISMISEKMIESFNPGINSENYYVRISSENKIKINELEDKKEVIEKIISKLDIVEKAIGLLNSDIEDMDKFERAKSYIINEYKNLKSEYSGTEIYDRMLKKGYRLIGNSVKYKVPLEYLIVYIFDKCDIFEKEEE